MTFRKVAKSYLSFSKKDRLGLLLLSSLVLLMYLLPALFSTGSPPLQTDSLLTKSVRQIAAEQKAAYEEKKSYAERDYEKGSGQRSLKGKLFPFNPNTLSEKGWTELGLSAKTAGTIQKYRSKGGRFRKPEDLKKIWGLPPGFYERVAPYIMLEEAPVSIATSRDKELFPNALPSRRLVQPIDINSADSALWETLPGIGPRLASRIIGFRKSLGGFAGVDQVAETYGLPDSTFQNIKQLLLNETGIVRKININTATKEDLKSHPYIRWKLANAITAYREQHGPFKQLSDLKRIHAINDELYEKLKPYLHIEAQ